MIELLNNYITNEETPIKQKNCLPQKSNPKRRKVENTISHATPSLPENEPSISSEVSELVTDDRTESSIGMMSRSEWAFNARHAQAFGAIPSNDDDSTADSVTIHGGNDEAGRIGDDVEDDDDTCFLSPTWSTSQESVSLRQTYQKVSN